MKWFLLLVVFIQFKTDSPLNFNSTQLETKTGQKEELDPRLIGVWEPILTIKDGEIYPDKSVDEKYLISYQKNGNVVMDIRAVREMTASTYTSNVDFPIFKWKTVEGVLETSAYKGSTGQRIPNSDRKRYYFKGDTLVKSVDEFMFFYKKVQD